MCARTSGEREACGRATPAWGYSLFGSGTPYLPSHLPGALDGLSLALGVSCSDLLLSPSSASSTEFPSSESLGWLVSVHLGVWDISEAWLQDSERTQEGLPLKMSGLGAPGVLRCREVLRSPHLLWWSGHGDQKPASCPGSPVLTISSGWKLFLGLP